MTAVEQKNINVMEWLITNGVNINEQVSGNGTTGIDMNGHTALSIAITQECVSIEVVELLLKYNADPRLAISVDGETFTDLTFYMSRQHSTRVLAYPMTKFSYLVMALHYQIELLNSSNDRESILCKIAEIISRAKDVEEI